MYHSQKTLSKQYIRSSLQLASQNLLQRLHVFFQNLHVVACRISNADQVSFMILREQYTYTCP